MQPFRQPEVGMLQRPANGVLRQFIDAHALLRTLRGGGTYLFASQLPPSSTDGVHGAGVMLKPDALFSHPPDLCPQGSHCLRRHIRFENVKLAVVGASMSLSKSCSTLWGFTIGKCAIPIVVSDL